MDPENPFSRSPVSQPVRIFNGNLRLPNKLSISHTRRVRGPTHPIPPRPINAARLWVCDSTNIESSLAMISSRPMNLRSMAKGTVEEGVTILRFLANSAITHSQSTGTRGTQQARKKPIGLIKYFCYELRTESSPDNLWRFLFKSPEIFQCNFVAICSLAIKFYHHGMICVELDWCFNLYW